jgi:hypothetical protein
MEGIWTALRNFLRPFRGVHKKSLVLHVAMFEWAHNLKRVTPEFVRMFNGAKLISPNSRYETEGFTGHRVPVILCA